MRLHRAEGVALVALALILRLPLLVAYPAVHGGDSVARLAHSDQLVLAYQLPLPQAIVFVVRALLPDPFWTRLAFVLVGSLLPVALGDLVARVSGRSGGLAAGALIALHPLFAYYSLVPYQESLMMLLLFAGASALLRQRELGAGLCVGLACLCRYEAWIGAGLFGAGSGLFGADRGWRRLARSVLLFGWAPAAWMLLWRGLAPSGTYVLDVDPEAGRAARLGFVLDKVRQYSGDMLLVLAAAGAFWLAWRRERRWLWAGAFVFLVLLVTVVAGHEFPPGSGRVSERLAHVPAAALCALGGLALGALIGDERSPLDTPLVLRRSLAAAVLSGLAVLWAHRTRDLVAEANRDPSLRLARAVAVFADRHLPGGAHLAVAAPPVEAAALEAYVEKVRRSGGDVDRAREVARSLSRRSPDADRIAAHLARRAGTVIAVGEGEAPLVAVFDDAPDAAAWRTGEPLGRFEAGPRAVAVYVRPARAELPPP